MEPNCTFLLVDVVLELYSPKIHLLPYIFVLEDLLVVHMVINRKVVQVDPGRVEFLGLFLPYVSLTQIYCLMSLRDPKPPH